ncbi:MAG: nucleotidyltransferase family protein [Oscillospiraceae bacterium]|nr:nucleotidyltransferase family protein [Oscillospiraceae bacterium]
MRIFGIVAEYNPFHNGHLHQISETRKNGATHIIAVMSGNYVQRGDTAMIDKFKRAEIAVSCGADLAIELPTPYALSSAEFFAKGAVSILHSLGCVDGISFGSECGDIEKLYSAAVASKNLSNSAELKNLLEDGIPYPLAMQRLAHEKFGEEVSDVFSHPNNLLGIEYLKALDFFESGMKPMTIPRKEAMHDSMDAFGEIASASFVRNLARNHDDYARFVPQKTAETLKKCFEAGEISDIINLEKPILYKLRSMTPDEISNIPDVSHGLEHRIFSGAKSAKSLDELMFLIKTKRYPLAKIRRILLCALLGIKKEHMGVFPPYARVLAVNGAGVQIIKKAQKTSLIPIDTSLLRLSKINPDTKLFSELEALATDIYALSLPKIQACGREYTTKIKKTEQEFKP